MLSWGWLHLKQSIKTKCFLKQGKKWLKASGWDSRKENITLIAKWFLLQDLFNGWVSPSSGSKDFIMCSYLLNDLITLLQPLSSVFQYSAGFLVDFQPLLIITLREVSVRQTQSPQACKTATCILMMPLAVGASPVPSLLANFMWLHFIPACSKTFQIPAAF